MEPAPAINQREAAVQEVERLRDPHAKWNPGIQP